MKNRRASICLTTTLLALTLGAPCFAQDNAAPKPDEKSASGFDPQMMATMMALAKPGENHKILAETTGSWNYKGKGGMGPDDPPVEATGPPTPKAVRDG